MWLGELLAAEPPGGNDSLIVMIGGVIVAALGALSVIAVEIIKGRNSRTTASPPAPNADSSTKDVELYERTAVLNVRADDADERHHLLETTVHRNHEESDDRHDRSERRLTRLERHLGIHDDDEVP